MTVNLKKNRMMAKIVMGFSVLVMFSWIFDIPALSFPLSGIISMKFNATLSFLFAGFLLYLSSKPTALNYAKKKFFILLCGVLLLILMAPSFLGIVCCKPSDWNNFFVQDARDVLPGGIPGAPSIGTTIAFIFLSMIAFALLFSKDTAKTVCLFCGGIAAFFGALALFGYLVNAPILYYSISNVSNGMAITTAILFVILGKGFFDLGKDI